MSGLVRMGALPRLYSRIASRPIFTSAVRQYKPVPTTRPPYASELEALQVKEKGPWGELTKQEKIDRKLFRFYSSEIVRRIPHMVHMKDNL